MSDYAPEIPPLAAYGPGDLDDLTLNAQARRPTTNGAARNGHKTPAMRVPPHNLDAEHSLLGAALLSNDARTATVDLVDPTDFYKPANGHIWAAIRTLHNSGEPVDTITVAHELGGLLDAVGGPATLTSLIASTVGTRNADRYARIVTDMALLRRITRVAGEITNQAYELPDDPHQLADAAAEALHLLTSGQLAAVDRRVANGRQFILDIPVGVPAVWGDDDGNVLWAEGEALILVGPPGVGKTTLGGQVVWARLGLDTHVLGYPVAPTTGRVLYLACDRPRQIARALNRLAAPDNADELAERLVVWQGPPPADLGEDPAALHRLARQHGCDTVVIDSLKDVAVNLNDDKVGANLNRAMQTCLAEGVEVIAYHHQRKAQGVAKPKQLEDVYGSTWITAGAGSVVLLWGRAGDLVVELGHLKQPANEVGPLKVVHDHDTGRTELHGGFDPIVYLRHVGAHGATTTDFARQKFQTFDVTDNQVQKARRDLQKLVAKGVVHRVEGSHGGAGGTTADHYHLIDNHRESPV